MHRSLALLLIVIPCSLSAADREPDGPFLNLLWLVHEFGTEKAAHPAQDVATKADIVAALRMGTSLTQQALDGLITPDAFARLAGDDGLLDAAEVQRLMEKQIPQARTALAPALAKHAKLLTTGFDQIDETHRRPIGELVDWIVENQKPGTPLPIVFVCTGNSRRSMIGAAMGNMAAAYYGLKDVRCYSGGTLPSAFNRRTIAALREIGFEIEATGRQSPPGTEPVNPMFKVHWGKGADGESLEFSKRYDDPQNPRRGFAAVMVCGEADASCPTVPGAGVRISMPYVDPKLYDDTDLESAKYAERRDDIGRAMLSVMMQARLRLVAKGRL